MDNFFGFNFFCFCVFLVHSTMVSVLQSASVERFDVSRMRDFLPRVISLCTASQNKFWTSKHTNLAVSPQMSPPPSFKKHLIRDIPASYEHVMTMHQGSKPVQTSFIRLIREQVLLPWLFEKMTVVIEPNVV